MALTLSQGAQFVADAGYLARIRDSMIRFAASVMAESLTVPVGGGSQTTTQGLKRKTLANAVLTNPNAWSSQFLSLVASDPGASLAWFVATPIASSTNANPSVVTTASAHGLVVGDVVEVTGHLVNTAANGMWTLATVGSTTTFTVPFPANGVGAATGQVMKMETDVNLNFTIQNQWNPMANTYAGDGA
jgi:hypothetical protein